MNKSKYQRTVAKLAKARLERTIKSVNRNAEEAWQAQRKAVRLIDFKNDEVKGEKQLKELEDSLNLWIISLEVLEHAAKEVAARANKALHSGGSDEFAEEDSKGVISDRSADEGDGRAAGRLARRPDGRGGRGRNGGNGAYCNAVGKTVRSVRESFKKGFEESRKISLGEH